MREKNRSIWPKILIGFLVGLPVGLALVYLIFANTVIKSTLETQLGNAHGAEVNIGNFDHSLFPLTVTLADVQMTNAAKPTYNQLTVKTITADMAWGPLLSGDVVVNELNVLGIQMQQARTSPGAVYRQPENSGQSGFRFPSAEDLPDVETLLERSPLKTTTAIADAQKTYDTHYQSLQEQYANLPDKTALEQYKKDVEAIKNLPRNNPAAIAEAATKLKALKARMSADKAKVSAFLKDAKTAQTALSDSASKIQVASAEDYQELSLLLAGDQAAFARVTETVFGKEFAQYSEYLTMALQIVLPMLQGDGTAEPETEEVTEPPLYVLVKEANVSVELQGNEWMSQWKDITSIHERLGRPTTFLLDGKHDGQIISTAGEFFIGKDGVTGKQQWDLQNLLMQAVQLVDNEQLGAVLESARISSTGALSIANNQLSGNSDIVLSALSIDADSDSDFGSIVASTLQNLNSLNINTDVKGSVLSPDLSFSSDLDRHIANSLASQLTGANGKQNPVLAEKLAALTNTSDAQMQQGLGQIGQWLSTAEGDGNTLDNLIATQTDSLIEKGKSKLFDKLIKKLGQ